MARARRKPVVDLAELLGSWELQLQLRAERKSAETLKPYGIGVRAAYLARCERAGRPAVVDRQQLREFVAALRSEGARPSTAASRHLAVRRFSASLTEEGEQTSDPLLGIRAPKLDKPVVEPLTDDQLRAMLKACRGADLWDKRDEAILRPMFTTGARAGEVVALQVTDLSLRTDPASATIRRGKGGRAGSFPSPRRPPRPSTATSALARHIAWPRRRRCGWGTAARASPTTPCTRLWACGPVGFHPHMLRHTAAHRWLAKSGSEGGLMAVAG